MKAKLIISVMVLLCLNFMCSAQKMSVKDSINVFYDSIFFHMQEEYLFKENVDFDFVKPVIKKKALDSNSFEEAVEKASILFDTIQDKHCGIFYNGKYHANTKGRQFTQKDFSTSYLLKYEQQPKFEVKVLQDQYGYIFIPGMLLMGLSEDSLHQVTQNMYNQVVNITDDTTIKGWIIDLRFNIGGNAYPMILSLYHLLGDATVYTELDNNKKIKYTNRLKEGKFFGVKDKLETYIESKKKPNTEIPVAIINGIMTTSAGEDVAVAFKGRQNVKFIGEPTNGYLTGNEEVKLPFDITMVMTTAYIADRNGVYYHHIEPDIHISKKDNFEELSKDENIMEAIKFFKSK